MDFTCPSCHAIYHAAPQHSGSHIRCSKCGKIVQVPAAVEARIVAADPQTVATPHARRAYPTPQAIHGARRWGIVAVAGAIAVSLCGVVYLNRQTQPAQADAAVPSSLTASGAEVQPQQVQPGQNPQQNGVQQIIGIFGGKKKQQQQAPPK